MLFWLALAFFQSAKANVSDSPSYQDMQNRTGAFQDWVAAASRADLDALFSEERELDVIERRNKILKKLEKQKLDGYIDGMTFEEGRIITFWDTVRFDLVSANSACADLLKRINDLPDVAPKDFYWSKLYSFGFPKEEKEKFLKKLDPKYIDFINTHPKRFEENWLTYVGAQHYLQKVLTGLTDEARYAIYRVSLIESTKKQSSFGLEKK